MDRTKFKVKTLKAIDNIYDQMEKMEQKRGQLSDSAKNEFDKQLTELKNINNELTERVKKMEESSKSSWDDARDIISDSMKYYKAGFKELGKLFK